MRAELAWQSSGPSALKLAVLCDKLGELVPAYLKLKRQGGRSTRATIGVERDNTLLLTRLARQAEPAAS